ncbi:G1/S-specific cyclin-E1 [Batrachochytrium dendrobatidis]|nr:G1/S-specific cyclin-E1 [Batrachochytrium dendrobatidis]
MVGVSTTDENRKPMDNINHIGSIILPTPSTTPTSPIDTTSNNLYFKNKKESAFSTDTITSKIHDPFKHPDMIKSSQSALATPKPDTPQRLIKVFFESNLNQKDTGELILETDEDLECADILDLSTATPPMSKNRCYLARIQTPSLIQPTPFQSSLQSLLAHSSPITPHFLSQKPSNSLLSTPLAQYLSSTMGMSSNVCNQLKQCVPPAKMLRNEECDTLDFQNDQPELHDTKCASPAHFKVVSEDLCVATQYATRDCLIDDYKQLYTETFKNVDLETIRKFADNISNLEEKAEFECVLDQWINDLWDEARIDRVIRKSDILMRHPQLEPPTRYIVLEWMREVSAQVIQSRKTFHMAVKFLDGFLALNENLAEDDFQLVAAACLFLSSRFEETLPPTLRFFAEFNIADVDDQQEVERTIKCTRDFTEKVEANLLYHMHWDALIPTMVDFLARYFQFAYTFWPQKETHWLPTSLMNNEVNKDCFKCFSMRRFDPYWYASAASIMDQTLFYPKYLEYKHSVIAAAAFWLSWPDKDTRQEVAEAVTGLKVHQIMPCVEFIRKCDIQVENFIEVVRGPMWEFVVDANANSDDKYRTPFDIVDNQIMGLPRD